MSQSIGLLRMTLPLQVNKKKQPRQYQVTCFEKAKESNIIVHLKTGLGKTLISCLLIEHTLNTRTDDKLIVFLAPQVPLVEQQARVISHEVPNSIVCKLHGQMHLDRSGWNETHWKNYLKKCGNVLICTPAILNNMLTHGFINMYK